MRVFIESTAWTFFAAFESSEELHTKCSEDEEKKEKQEALVETKRTIASLRWLAFANQISNLRKRLNDRIQQSSYTFGHLQQFEHYKESKTVTFTSYMPNIDLPRAILSTLITRIRVGLIGRMCPLFIFSMTMPAIERTTIIVSN